LAVNPLLQANDSTSAPGDFAVRVDESPAPGERTSLQEAEVAAFVRLRRRYGGKYRCRTGWPA